MSLLVNWTADTHILSRIASNSPDSFPSRPLLRPLKLIDSFAHYFEIMPLFSFCSSLLMRLADDVLAHPTTTTSVPVCGASNHEDI